MGIGLALARELVELHGGTIQARSDGVGKGSEFIVRLAIARIGARTAPSCALDEGAPPVNIRPYRNIAPVLGARVYVDPAAIVIGRVQIGDDSSIWPTAVVRGDVHSIEIGARTSIQDGSVLHVTHDGPYAPGGRALNVGSDVTVGHRVTLHACTIGNTCLVGMGAVVLDDVVTEDFVMIGAGSVVPPGKRLETRGLYVGSPARRVRDLTQKEIEFFTYSAAHTCKVKDEYLQRDASSIIRACHACCFDRFEHRLRIRLDASPEQERFGGLLHQHAPAGFGASRAGALRPARERRIAFAVGHVVAQRRRADRRRGGIGGIVVLQARRRRVQHQIERRRR